VIAAVERLRRRYGAGPLHLLALAACFTLAWYAGSRLLAHQTARVALWFVGAAVVHDLVLLPLYSAADRGAQRAIGRLRRKRLSTVGAAAGINHIRFPAALSALLFLVWLPEILGQTAGYDETTALDGSRFLPRWLLITVCLFAVSALVGVVRAAVRHVGRGRPTDVRRTVIRTNDEGG